MNVLKKRKTIEDYKKLKELYGFEWVGSKIPRNFTIKTEFLCPKGHIFLSRYKSICEGVGCGICNKSRSKVKSDYLFISKLKEIIWLDRDVPKNYKIKARWVCKEGHIFERSLSNIQYSKISDACPICRGITPNDYRILAKDRGYKWIRETYPKTCYGETFWICDKGHMFKKSYLNFKYSSKNCPICKKPKDLYPKYFSILNEIDYPWAKNKIGKICLGCGMDISLEKYYKNDAKCKECIKSIVQNRRYSQKRYKNNIIYRLKSLVSSGIRRYFKKNENSHWFNILGYTGQQLKENIESKFEPWMSWENMGRNGWDLDHIIPLKYKNPDGSYYFNQKELTDPNSQTFKEAWGLDNLQPLKGRENASKGNRYMGGYKNDK